MCYCPDTTDLAARVLANLEGAFHRAHGRDISRTCEWDRCLSTTGCWVVHVLDMSVHMPPKSVCACMSVCMRACTSVCVCSGVLFSWYPQTDDAANGLVLEIIIIVLEYKNGKNLLRFFLQVNKGVPKGIVQRCCIKIIHGKKQKGAPV